MEVAQLLLSRGAAIDVVTEVSTLHLTRFVARYVLVINAVQDGWQPLHAASGNGHVAVAAFLLDHGADVNCATQVCHPNNGRRVVLCEPSADAVVPQWWMCCAQWLMCCAGLLQRM